VSNVGAALGGVQAADSAGISGSVLAEPSAASQQRARLLVLGLDLLLRKLEPVGDLVDDLGVQEVGLQPRRQHAADGRPSRPELPTDRDDRHVLAGSIYFTRSVRRESRAWSMSHRHCQPRWSRGRGEGQGEGE